MQQQQTKVTTVTVAAEMVRMAGVFDCICLFWAAHCDIAITNDMCYVSIHLQHKENDDAHFENNGNNNNNNSKNCCTNDCCTTLVDIDTPKCAH